MPPLEPDRLEPLRGSVQDVPGLDLLLLHGSRARAEARPDSDWDFAYLGRGVDSAALLARLVETLGTDHVDLVDLSSASGVIRFRAARDGVVIYARDADADRRFRFEAATFWCEAAPVLEQGYADVLRRLPA